MSNRYTQTPCNMRSNAHIGSIGTHIGHILPALGAQAQAVDGLTVNVSQVWQKTNTAKANEKRMVLPFRTSPCAPLLQLLGETAGVNIVTDESVGGDHFEFEAGRLAGPWT